jgi:hypothetical protein
MADALQITNWITRSDSVAPCSTVAISGFTTARCAEGDFRLNSGLRIASDDCSG